MCSKSKINVEGSGALPSGSHAAGTAASSPATLAERAKSAPNVSGPGTASLDLTPKKRPTGGDWQPTFLACFRENGNVRQSAQHAGVTRQMVYYALQHNENFAKEFEDAKNDAVESLMSIAWERAKIGSDTLLIFLLKSLDPARFAEKAELRHTGTVRQTHVVFDAEMLKTIAQTREVYLNEEGYSPSSNSIPPGTQSLDSNGATHLLKNN